jgi:hypothetical protein
MSVTVAVLNLILGSVYTSYGVMTAIDLKRGWRTMGFSHFGLAWIAMAFTCGPHHLEHGAHLAFAGRDGGALDLIAVLVGLPAGLAWFLLRVEALSGGRGDRFISGTPATVRAIPVVAGLYGATAVVVAIVTLRTATSFGPRITPNLLLLGVYCLIGYYLLRTQLANRGPHGGWSVSGLALTVVFPTCALMHAVYALYATTARYDVEWHGLTIDWLAVPAAVYFVWVVRSLYLGAFSDWNRSLPSLPAQPIAA